MTVSPQDIRINARIAAARPDACRYTVDRPVFEGSAYFWSKDSARSAPLAEKLISLPGVKSVRLAGNDVIVVRETAEDWKGFSLEVGKIIRAQFCSGEPAVAPGWRADLKGETELKNRVQMVFDEEINPAVASHGGHIELVDVKDHKVFLRMGGGCQGCGSANATLRQGIETTLRERFPELDELVDVTDHASGANPYHK